jgi:catechol 2,3-dioxygenase-like lactoylglutathione lyase family enzyme
MIESIAFTVYPVKDVAKSRRFYEDILGLKVTHNWDDQWVEYDLGDTTFAITTMDDGHIAGAKGATIAFEVADFEKAVALLRQRGATFKGDLLDTPVCRMAVLHDPDATKSSIHKRNAG